MARDEVHGSTSVGRAFAFRWWASCWRRRRSRASCVRELDELAARTWRHPISGEPVRFGVSTIERWYYRARKERHDPVGVLRRKLRSDAGRQASSVTAVARRPCSRSTPRTRAGAPSCITTTCSRSPQKHPELGPVPSYSTLRRFLKAHGLEQAPASDLAADRRRRARRGALVRSRGAQLRGRVRQRPVALGLPRRIAEGAHLARRVARRRCCSACSTIARGLPVICNGTWRRTPRTWRTACRRRSRSAACRAAGLSDNGAAMTAAEIAEGLARLGIVHQTTLPYSPYQNGKQETFWGPVEGRLLAMLEDVPDLTLALLNEATQAWVELEYNRKRHSEIGEAPLARFLKRSRGDAAEPGQRGVAARLHPHRAAHPAQERRHRGDRGPPLRGAQPLPPSARRRGPLRQLGSHHGPSGGQPHRQRCCAGSIPRTRPKTPAACAGRSTRCRQSPPPAKRARQAAAASRRCSPNCSIKQAATGLPPPYLPKDEGDDT